MIKSMLRNLLVLILGVACCGLPALAADESIIGPEITQQDVDNLVNTMAVIYQYYIKPTTYQELFNYAVNGMVEELDPHSAFLDKKALTALKSSVAGKFIGIGVELTTYKGVLKVIAPIEGSPAARAGIKGNDLILKINDYLVNDLSMEEAVTRIKGKPGTTVKLTILHDGASKPITVEVVRRQVRYIAVKTKMLMPHYGYSHLTIFQGPVDKQIKASIAILKRRAKPLYGMVLDLRNNPGGLLTSAVNVSGLFLTKERLKRYQRLIVSIKGRDPASVEKFRSNGSDILKDIPVVVLINGGSASASEIVAGALQDYKRAVIVGTKSFGKGSVQTVIPIGKDSALKLTTALYYTPAGREIQANGIIPDVIAPELTVKKDISQIYEFGEDDFENHLGRKGSPIESRNKEVNEKRLRRQMMSLAVRDSQLYEALSILQGMHSMGWKASGS